MEELNLSSILEKLIKSDNCNKPCSGLSYHYQESKTYKGTIRWSHKISDIGIFSGKYRDSKIFSIGNTDICKLFIRVHPKEKKKGDSRFFFALSLCFQSKLPNNSCYHCTFSFLDDCGQNLGSISKSGSGKDLSLVEFKDFVLNQKCCSMNEKLIIQCVIMIYCQSFHFKSDVSDCKIEDQEVQMPIMALQDKMSFSDIILKIGNEEITADKALLASKVPLLQSQMKEYETEKGLKYTILYENTCALKGILDFIYSGNIWFKSVKNAYEIYVAASYFDVHKLRDICSAYIGANLCEKNVFRMLLTAQEHYDKHLMKACIEFITEQDSATLITQAVIRTNCTKQDRKLLFPTT